MLIFEVWTESHYVITPQRLAIECEVDQVLSKGVILELHNKSDAIAINIIYKMIRSAKDL